MRVIQDSDDEFEEEVDVCPLSHDPDHGSAPRPNASLENRGTGSTDSLKMLYSEARTDHLQTVPAAAIPLVQDGPPSSVSLPDQGIGRGLFSATLDTHGSGLYERSVNHTAGIETSRIHSYSKTVDLTSQEPQLLLDIQRNLQTENHGGFAEHGPMALFPEPSSTVPNATLTQQRVLETVAAPAFLGISSEIDISNFHPVEHASVPWSDLMKLSPEVTGEQPMPSNQSSRSQVPIRMSQMSCEQGLPISPNRNRAASVNLIGSPPGSVPQPSKADPLDLLRPPVEPLSSQGAGAHLNFKEETKAVTQEPTHNKRKEEGRKITAGDSEDDLIVLDLPGEQYKPRPSRSRSMKTTNSSQIDHAITTGNRSKVTRSRTSVEQSTSRSLGEGSTPVTTPQKIRQICDMGFTPSTTERALKKNHGDVAQSVEWLVSNNLGEDELASHVVPRRKHTSKEKKGAEPHRSGNPQLANNRIEQTEHGRSTVYEQQDITNQYPGLGASTESHTQPVATSTTGGQTRSPHVKVVIPLKPSDEHKPSPKRVLTDEPKKKSKRRKTTSDIPEAKKSPDAAPDVLLIPTTTTGKKRGRGRPRKAELVEKPIKENDPMPSIAHQNLQIDTGSNAGESTTMMQQAEQVDIKNAAPTEASPKGCSPPEGRTLTPELTPSEKESRVSLTPQQAAQTGSGPPNKGKAIYRVGLSKRARIAPLLRTLKK